MATANRSIVKAFVTETLGCACPETVFEQVEYANASERFGFHKPLHRVLIGQRLLIYFLEADDAAELRSLLPMLLEKGRMERDQGGYHRLRVVVIADRPESLQQEAERLFRSAAGVDEKTHLHVLTRDPDWERMRGALRGFAAT